MLSPNAQTARACELHDADVTVLHGAERDALFAALATMDDADIDAAVAELRAAGLADPRNPVPAYAFAQWEGDKVTNKGDLPLWSGKGEPPLVGAVVELSGPRNAVFATITGYEVDAGWLMAKGYRTAEPNKRGNLAGAEIRYPRTVQG